MINDLGLSLTKPILNQPLHVDTFSKVIIDRNFNIVRRLSYVTHGIKEVNHVLELNDAALLGLKLWCKVRTECAWVGAAREQVEPFMFMAPELLKSPRYVINAGLLKTNTYDRLFDFEYESKDPAQIRKVCQEIKTHLNSLI